MRWRFRVLVPALFWMVGWLAFLSSEVVASGSPYFNGFAVLAQSRPSGMKTLLWVYGIADPEGTVPDSIASMTVTGPNDFSYSFVRDDFFPSSYDRPGYYRELSGLPADGEYTLTVTSTSGKTRSSTFWLTVGETIPLPDPSTFQASGTNPLTPTLSWGAIPDYYSGPLSYRVWISDMNGTDVWDAALPFNTTSVTVPSGYLLAGHSYQWQVGATDSLSSASSNKRAKSDLIPLVLDNTRPYLANVAAFKWHNTDGTFSTGLWARGGLPSGELSSLTVTGPNEFQFTTTPPSACFLSGPGCVYNISGIPENGFYTFQATDVDNNTAVSYFRLYSYNVPLVNFATMRASGNVLAPVLSWSAPETIDKPLYYQSWIWDPQNQVVWSSWTTNTSITVPQGILQSGVLYNWRLVVYDSPYFGWSNRSITAQKPLTIDNSLPFFTYVLIDDRNTHDGHFIGINPQVRDPNGSVPGSITSLTVSAPGGESYSFQPSDYYSADNEYYHQFPGAPPEEGLYTFTVTDNGGNSTETYLYYTQGGGTIPLLNDANFQVTGNALAPTISWSAIPGYSYHPYYRVRILDSSGNVVYMSSEPYSPYTSHVVPSGKLVSGKVYRYRIEAFDAPYWQAHYNRAVSNYIQLPSGALAAKNPYFRNCSVLARNTPSGINTSLTVVISDPDGSVPDTISALSVSGPNGFSYSFIPADYHGSGEYWHDLPGLPADGQYTFTVTDFDGNTATSYFYLTVGQIIPVPDSSYLLASGVNPLTPTLSWSTIPDYPGNLFYQGRVYDMADNIIWTSGINFNTTRVTVPSGVLATGVSYKIHLDAFDGSGYYDSNNRGYSAKIPLNIDNTRPYLDSVAIYKHRNANANDAYMTTLNARGGGYVPLGSSLVVTGPNGFECTFDLDHQCFPIAGSVLYMCTNVIPGAPEDGSYTFTLTNAESNTAVSYFHLTSYNVPLVDPATAQASGNALAPTLSWGAPATIDRPLYYVVFINDPTHTIWGSPWTTQTSVTVPSGILQPGISYRWNVVTNDSKYLYSSNRSYSLLIDLSVPNSPPRLSRSASGGLGAGLVNPYFSYAVAYDRNTPDGHFTAFNVVVGDPDGTIPSTITSLTVTGPGGFSYAFQPSDYLPAENEYYHQGPNNPWEGLYTFTVTDNTGRSAVTHHYHRDAGGTIPLFDENSFELSGHPLVPTMSWSTISDYAYHLYYRVRIVDNLGNPIYSSAYSPNSYLSVPSGKLSSGITYQYRVEAVDCPDFGCYDNRAVSNYLQLPLAIELASFRAKASTNSVLLQWETGCELNNAGFHLWRARTSGGKYTRITKALITANGSPAMGAEYSYEDSAVAQGKSYSYKLEDIDTSGKSTFHGPVRAVVGTIALVSPESGASTPPKAPPTLSGRVQPTVVLNCRFPQRLTSLEMSRLLAVQEVQEKVGGQKRFHILPLQRSGKVSSTFWERATLSTGGSSARTAPAVRLPQRSKCSK